MSIEEKELEKNMEVVNTLQQFVGTTVNESLLNPDDCWQPTDFLPDLSQENAIDDIKQLQFTNSLYSRYSNYIACR